MSSIRNLVKQTVRDLRKNQTDGEAILWEALRNRKLAGRKFLRQHPIIFGTDGKQKFFVADFYCSEARMVVEVDGGIHNRQKDYDEFRDEIIKERGLKVLRIKNELVKKDLAKVLEVLGKELTP